MVITIHLNDKPTKLKLVISATYRTKVWIMVKDKDRPNTYYTKRYGFVEGTETFYILMPQTPVNAQVIVYNDENGIIKNDNSFQVLEVKALDYQVTKTNFSKKTSSFIKFAQEFCDEAGYISASPKGDIYKSNNGRFRIDYFDAIRNNNGNVIKTPARISQISGKMEVSAEQFKTFTIPMRMAILLHEYSHYYLNKNPSNEVEADINGLNIYLKLGYPKIDIYNVFLNVFKTAPSEGNKQRFQKLDAFVKNHKI